MSILPDDEFLAWFFTYFMGDATCPHCGSVVYEDEVTESGPDYAVCPHCGEKISKDDFS